MAHTARARSARRSGFAHLRRTGVVTLAVGLMLTLTDAGGAHAAGPVVISHDQAKLVSADADGAPSGQSVAGPGPNSINGSPQYSEDLRYVLTSANGGDLVWRDVNTGQTATLGSFVDGSRPSPGATIVSDYLEGLSPSLGSAADYWTSFDPADSGPSGIGQHRGYEAVVPSGTVSARTRWQGLLNDQAAPKCGGQQLDQYSWITRSTAHGVLLTTPCQFSNQDGYFNDYDTYIWDPAAGTFTLASLWADGGRPDPSYSRSFHGDLSDDGNQVAYLQAEPFPGAQHGAQRESLFLWNRATGQRTRVWPKVSLTANQSDPPQANPQSVTISRNGRVISDLAPVAAGPSGTVPGALLFLDGENLWMPIPDGAPTSAAFKADDPVLSPNGRWVASTVSDDTFNRYLLLYDTTTNDSKLVELVAGQALDSGFTNVLAVNDDGELLLSTKTPLSDRDSGTSRDVYRVDAGPDVTAPTITIDGPSDGMHVQQHAPLTAHFHCGDSGAGVASCAGTVADGQLIDTSSPGLHTFTVDAVDHAGNHASVSSRFTVDPTPTFPVTGTVSTLPGKAPLMGVSVQARNADSHELVTATTTSSDGTYTLLLPAGDYELRATPASGSAYQVATVARYTVSQSSTVDIGLAQAGASAVQGRLLDRDGRPISRAYISFNNNSSGAYVQTDANGYYAALLPDGIYTLEIADYSANTAHDAHVPAYFQTFNGHITVVGSDYRDVVLAAHDITVHVTDAAGHPVAGVQPLLQTDTAPTVDVLGENVSVTYSESSTQTNAAGVMHVYAFTTPAGRQLQLTAPADSGVANKTGTLPAVNGDLDLTYELPAAHLVSGRILDRDGNPIRRVQMAFTSDDGATYVNAGEDGLYSVRLGNGSYHIDLFNAGYNADHAAHVPQYFQTLGTSKMLTVADTDVSQDIVVRANVLTLHLTDTDGNPAVGVSPELNAGVGTATTQLLGATVESNYNEYYSQSDSDGTLRLYMLDTQQGRQLTLRAPRDGVVGDTTIALPAVTEDGDLDVTLPRAYPVTGQVLDRDGRPISRVFLSFTDGAASAYAQADTEGRYHLSLPNGHYSVQLSDYGYNQDHAAHAPEYFQTFDGPSVLTVGGSAVTQNIVLHANDIAVHILDASGNPLSGASPEMSANGASTSILGHAVNAIYNEYYSQSDAGGVLHVWALDTPGGQQLQIDPPTSSGLPNAKLTLPKVASDLDLTLSYVGGSPSAVSLTPNVLDAGHVITGHGGPGQTVALTNLLGPDLTTSQVRIAGADADQFAVGDDGCTGTTLAVSRSCQVTVTFTPSSLGAKNAVLTLADDGPGSPRHAALNGSGDDATAPTATISSPTSGQQITNGDELVAHFSCHDEPAGSGVAGCTAVADGSAVADGGHLSSTEAGTHTLTVTATDRAGNTSTASVSYIVLAVDHAAPSIDVSSPADGAPISEDDHVVAHYQCDDGDGSGVASCVGTVADGQAIDTSGPGDHTFTVTSIDQFGNQAVKTVTYTVVDRTDPLVTLIVPAADGQAGWHVHAPLIAHAVASDRHLSGLTCTVDGADSGQSSQPDPAGLAIDIPIADDGTHLVACAAADEAGNHGVDHGQVKLDTRAPQVSCSGQDSGWHPADQQVSCQAEDGASGLASSGDSHFTLSTSVPDGATDPQAHTDGRTVCDTAGNCTSQTPYTFKIDRRAPQVTLSASPDGQNNWFIHDPAQASAAADDDTLASLTCTVDGSDPAATTASSGHASQTVSIHSDGRHAVQCAATDAAGNISTRQLEVGLDTTPPAVQCAATPTGPSDVDVSVNCTAADQTSGLAAPVDATFGLYTSTQDGTEQNTSTDSRQVCDDAGLCTAAGPYRAVVDRKAPSLLLTQMPNGSGGWWTASPAIAHAAASDLTLRSLACSLDGQPSLALTSSDAAGQLDGDVKTVAEGTHPVACHAADGAAHVSNATLTLQVDRTAPRAPLPAASRAADYAGAGGWWEDSVTVSFSDRGDPDLADGSPGSGTAPGTLPSPVSYATAGSHTASGSVGDIAGNRSTSASLTVQVDTSAPTSTLTCPSGPSLGSSATASYQDADTGSGLTGPASGTVAVDTTSIGAKTATHTATDHVGHTTTSTCTFTVIDRAAPAITLTSPTNGANYQFGQQVTAQFSCADQAGGSGLASCTAINDGAAIANGAALPTGLAAVNRTHTFVVTATDQAGNSATRTVQYTVTTILGCLPLIGCP